MPKFKVKLREVVYYELEVEAENKDDALEQAEEDFVQHPNINDLFAWCEDREAIDVEKIS